MASSVINSDDGVISGTAGLKSVGGDDGSLAVQSNGTEVAKFKTTELVINDGGANYDFRVEGDTDANALFVDASTDRVGIGTSSPSTKVQSVINSGAEWTSSELLSGTTNIQFVDLFLQNLDTSITGTETSLLMSSGGSGGAQHSLALKRTASNLGDLIFRRRTGASTSAESMRITSDGDFLVGKTVTTFSTAGLRVASAGLVQITRASAIPLEINRAGNDGTLIEFYQDATLEGNISVSGSTVSYNGGHLSRWAQMLTKPDLLKGTVMSNLDEMNVYVKPTLYWTEDDELPVDEEGNPTVAVGDLKQETSVSDNEQLNKVKVSDVEGDANVAGVFVNWTYDEAHQVDEINMAMTGDMIIRIAQGVTVARGDLLMSAGDGTAKPQGDDIVRSKTIAKVTSTHVTCTYDDGSYCVPCVLMAC